MAKPSFAYTCKQHLLHLDQPQCNTRISSWQLVEDPSQGSVGIWATHCPGCNSFTTVELNAPEAP